MSPNEAETAVCSSSIFVCRMTGKATGGYSVYIPILPALWHFCISLVNYIVDVPIATLLVEVSVKKIQTLS